MKEQRRLTFIEGLQKILADLIKVKLIGKVKIKLDGKGRILATLYKV